MASLFGRLRQAASRRPFVANAVAVGGLFGVGDVLSQRMERAGHAHDWWRTARMMAVGTFFVGPVDTWWYRSLDRVVRSRMARTGAVVGAKVAADQFLFTPPLLVAELGLLSTMQGMEPAEVVAHLRSKLPRLYVHDCAFWIPIQTINFIFVPVVAQVVVVNSAAVVWNAYLSHVQFQAGGVVEEARKEKARAALEAAGSGPAR